MRSLVELGRGVATSRAMAFTVRTALSRRVRVLAYHAVPEPRVFENHLRHLIRNYQFVSASDILAARSGKMVLAPRSLWVTFDDAYPSALAVGPLLADFGIRATMFVCPGVVGTQTPFWWQTLEVAVPDATEAARERLRLKKLPDPDRREEIQRLSGTIGAGRNSVQQATSEELLTWIALGHHLGNHTWDHPMLDTCSAYEQENQIVRAHDWLSVLLNEPPLLFAYPNGNSTPTSKELLRSLGYPCAALFDMRLARQPLAMEVSRIRIDAGSSDERLRAAASGSLGLFARAAGRVSEINTAS